MKASGNDPQRQRAAKAAVAGVRDGMKLGLGSGRSADQFTKLLGDRVRAGLNIVGVPTSEKTARLAASAGIALATLDQEPALDLTVDGADEIDPQLRLIKGGGGALLREKIVAAASARMIIVAEAAKRVTTLGAFPLPIEVVPFGLAATRIAVEAVASRLGLAGDIVLRNTAGVSFVTDGGHHILDASLARIPDPEALAVALARIPGVVEHGLFLDLADAAIIGLDTDVETLTR
ncbi:MAG: ribose-5-phosphate isomerase RpiA [Hyphomicrobiales bacterium]|nr:ribose-5-phosphate isomerase RpiA [Hyphomicrobiales bacterium]